ncbi:MAG: carbohydrate kinase family protein [Anaerolineae bacterium]
MTIAVTGSMAYDYIMSFPGRFAEHILPEQIEIISVSFLVDSMRRERGGCGGNIAYNLALLGQKPLLMATVGQDAPEYIAWLREQGVDTGGVLQLPDEFTASFFVSTDQDNNQIASFYTGAMARASEISFYDYRDRDIELAIISPNDPGAMVKYARECRELGIPYIYDPSQQIPRLSKEDLIQGIEGAKLLVVNDYEFEMIKNQTGLKGQDLRSAVEVTVITRGEAGSTIYADGQQPLDIPIVPTRRLADPTGMGDAYRAGLVAGLCQGFDWEISGRLGALTATYVLEEHGTQRHRYTLRQFVERYRQNFGDISALEALLSGVEKQTD